MGLVLLEEGAQQGEWQEAQTSSIKQSLPDTVKTDCQEQWNASTGLEQLV